MIIGGIQKVSLIDYPGKISAVIFTRGCSLRCHYCHNPQLVLPELFQGPISQDYLFGFLETRKRNLEGVVITGGEPTLHGDLLDFMKKIKEMGYKIKLDSCGIFPEVIKAAIDRKLVDYIAMDIKGTAEKYPYVTGVNLSYDEIRKSMEIIMNSNVDYEFRTTIVRSQLSIEELESIARSISGARRYVLQKFIRSRTLDPLFEQQTTYTDKELEKLRISLGRYVVECSVR